MANDEKPYDLIVVGAGIAGLAIAEIFSRSGLKVALLEKNSRVCQEASGEHHEWFHFGSLYSIFLNNQFMRTLVGGIDDLLTYYRDFPGMNIRVNKEGKLEFPEGPDAWICDKPIEYIVAARNDPDFDLKSFHGVGDYAKKCFFLLTWEMAIKQFIARHQRFHKFDWHSGPASEWVPKAGWLDYSRDVIYSITDLDANLDKHTHFLIPGFDRPMNALAIIQGLLRSFLSNKGELLLGYDVQGVEQAKSGHVRVLVGNGKGLLSKKIIFTSGKGLERFIGDSLKLKVVASPLLIVYPVVCRQSFVRLTPFIDKTVNHIAHSVSGKKYSLIGGGYYADPNDAFSVEKARSDLVKMAGSVFPKISEAGLAETYVGYKTELVSSGAKRNYQYHISEISENTYVAIPGKFSLAFSLAVNVYKKLMSSDPKVISTQDADLDVSIYTDSIRHRRIVSDFLMKNAADDPKNSSPRSNKVCGVSHSSER